MPLRRLRKLCGQICTLVHSSKKRTENPLERAFSQMGEARFVLRTDCHDQLCISSGSQICCAEACIFGPSLKSADWSRNDKTYVYRLGGPSCLSGDVIGDYEFDHPLEIGELVLFGDLAIYSTCKNNTFNGMPLPQIWRRREDGTLEQIGRAHV